MEYFLGASNYIYESVYYHFSNILWLSILEGQTTGYTEILVVINGLLSVLNEEIGEDKCGTVMTILVFLITFTPYYFKTWVITSFTGM